MFPFFPAVLHYMTFKTQIILPVHFLNYRISVNLLCKLFLFFFIQAPTSFSMDNRLEGSGEDAGSIRTLDPTPYSGDFASPEQMIPPSSLP